MMPGYSDHVVVFLEAPVDAHGLPADPPDRIIISARITLQVLPNVPLSVEWGRNPAMFLKISLGNGPILYWPGSPRAKLPGCN